MTTGLSGYQNVSSLISTGAKDRHNCLTVSLPLLGAKCICVRPSSRKVLGRLIYLAHELSRPRLVTSDPDRDLRLEHQETVEVGAISGSNWSNLMMI